MKNQIFRWKIFPASNSPQSAIPGDLLQCSAFFLKSLYAQMIGKDKFEFAAANDLERATWLGW